METPITGIIVEIIDRAGCCITPVYSGGCRSMRGYLRCGTAKFSDGTLKLNKTTEPRRERVETMKVEVEKSDLIKLCAALIDYTEIRSRDKIGAYSQCQMCGNIADSKTKIVHTEECASFLAELYLVKHR